MGLWNLYFIVVIYLGLTETIKPIWWANLLFALALLVPIRQRWLRLVRQVLAVLVGAALLYRESSLPPIGYALKQASQLSGFSGSYMMELARRVFDPAMVYVPVAALLVYAVINRWVRITTFVLIALIAVPLWQGITGMVATAASDQRVASNALNNPDLANAGADNGTGSYDEQLATFHHNEKARRVVFSPGASDPASQFDIIFIHICSLSWDDMDVANMRDNPLFDRFDYVFKNFSSAASYSGPAAIRVLRASCGQDAHASLYSAAPAECHVFADLAAAGYDVQFLMNHDGRFDDFRGVVEREIGVPGIQPQSNEGLPMAMREFDGSPLIGDYDALAKWYQARVARGGAPVALYYNTVTLHDGNRLPNSNLTSLQSYPIRLKMLLGDVDRLIDLISRSGRKAVLVFVPEHGAALRGDAGQISGLREIPTPRIINVPVGVKLIGLPADKDHHGQPIAVDTPTSYLALTQMVSNMLGDSPFGPNAPPLSQYANDLPQTRMVGENENTVTMKTTTGYVIHTPDGVWMEGK